MSTNASKMSKDQGGSNPYTVRSVDRALRLVDLVAGGPEQGMSLSEISRALGMSKSSVLATARTLLAQDYLRVVEPSSRYKLGMALIRLGDQTARQLPLGEMCQPVLRRLAAATGMTARIALADDSHPLFIARDDGPGTVRFHTPLGLRESPHSTAAGKAILATMSEAAILAFCDVNGLPSRTHHTITTASTLIEELRLVRRRGFAIDDQEDALGVFCIGAAFFDHNDSCMGALSVTGIKGDLTSRKVSALGAQLREHADEVSALLGGRRYEDLPLSLLSSALDSRDVHSTVVGASEE